MHARDTQLISEYIDVLVGLNRMGDPTAEVTREAVKLLGLFYTVKS